MTSNSSDPLISADRSVRSNPWQASQKNEGTTKLVVERESPSLPAFQYDENLLERALTQWQLGDWEGLAKIELDYLQHHQDRAKLALLSAAGHLQLGECSIARQFINLACDWGISKNLVSKILIAGVKNSLGRAEAVDGRKNEALEYFNEAIRIGASDCEVSLLAHARFLEQIRQLNLNSQILIGGSKESPTYSSLEDDMLELSDCRSIASPNLKDTERRLRPIVGKEIIYGEKIFKFFYRQDSIGDLGVIKQIFEEKQYEFGWLPQGKLIYKLYETRKLKEETSIIVDAGANIGASSVWFHLKFPMSLVLAIEPDEDNCELLGFNNAGKNVQLFHGGITDSKKQLFLNDPGQSDWAFRVEEIGSVVVNCIGPQQIVNYCKHNDYYPLIFKFDIEGSEDAVFKGNCDWLASVPMLIIELHDWLFPGERKSKNFINAMARHDFDMITRGENIFCFNREILSSIKT